MPHNLLIKNRRISFILLSAVVIVSPVFYFFIDLPVARFVNTGLPPAIFHFAEHITGAGNWFLWLFAVIALTGRLVFKNKSVFRKFLFPILTAMIAGIATTILKSLVGRYRPKDFFDFGNYGFEPFHNAASWPSGHSSGIMAFMAAVAILFPKWRVPCFAVAALIGSTRVVLNAHYSGDVFAGLILGYLCTHWLYYLLIRCKQLPEPERQSDL